jgi:hypothetical protein
MKSWALSVIALAYRPPHIARLEDLRPPLRRVGRSTWPTPVAVPVPAKPTALKLCSDARQYRNAFQPNAELKRCKAIDSRSGKVWSNAFAAFGQHIDEEICGLLEDRAARRRQRQAPQPQGRPAMAWLVTTATPVAKPPKGSLKARVMPRPNCVEFRLAEHGASPAGGSQGVVTERLTVSLSMKIR